MTLRTDRISCWRKQAEGERAVEHCMKLQRERMMWSQAMLKEQEIMEGGEIKHKDCC